jgi:outer membrane lipoprotein carrier protein
MKRTRWLIATLLSLMSIFAHAGDEAPVKQLKAFLSASKSMTANFKQVLINEAGDPLQTSYGQFYLQRPGKFRWDYTKPFQQQIISTSGKVWFYDTDLEQVTIKKLDESVGSTPALLLSGDVPLEDNYTIEQQGTEGDMHWIKLVPKSQDSTFKSVLIGLEKGALSGMQLNDNFGQLTRIYFSNVKLNQSIHPDLFEFKAPAGADVFGE